MMPAEFVVSRSCRWGKKCDKCDLTNGRKSVGTDIAPVHPAPIVTGGIGAEMLRGVHLAWASPAGGDQWRGGWGWGLWVLGLLLTGRTVRLVDEARKGFGVGGALAARRDGLGWLCLGRHAAAGPGEVQHDKQP